MKELYPHYSVESHLQQRLVELVAALESFNGNFVELSWKGIKYLVGTISQQADGKTRLIFGMFAQRNDELLAVAKADYSLNAKDQGGGTFFPVLESAMSENLYSELGIFSLLTKIPAVDKNYAFGVHSGFRSQRIGQLFLAINLLIFSKNFTRVLIRSDATVRYLDKNLFPHTVVNNPEDLNVALLASQSFYTEYASLCEEDWNTLKYSHYFAKRDLSTTLSSIHYHMILQALG